ncbi:DUF1684 domain-containing protein [Microbacterium kribbense]|uniref:DUF1684 domain-containing protein n=1 Tax=Microbacterium kribbense TaxID=433645 RepID=A0ABP7G4A6_9MICO
MGSNSDAAQRHAHWRRDRTESVTGPQGNLALVETRWYPAGTTIPAADLQTTEDGVTITTLRRVDLDTGLTQEGLRRWDAGSPAIKAFTGIDAYPYDPAWVVTGRYTPLDSGHTVEFEHMRDNGRTRDLAVPGRIDVEIGGAAYALSAFDDDGTLLLVFADPSGGTETYAAGRFLFVQRDADSYHAEGEVTLDFNRAFVPPCGFSDQYNCPFPPPSNRLAVPVRAGEKVVLFAPDAATQATPTPH